MRFLLSLFFCTLCTSNILGQSIVLRFQIEFQKQALSLQNATSEIGVNNVYNLPTANDENKY